MRLLGAILATTLTLSAGLVAAQDELAKLTAQLRPVTLHFEDASFMKVIEVLGDLSGITIRWSPDLDPGTLPPLTVRFKNARFADVFSFLMKTNNLSYTVVAEKTILIAPKP